MHFLGMACRAMRQVLVDHARRRSSLKRGGDWTRVPLDDLNVPGRRDYDTTLMALDQVLERFMARHPEKARLVDMHFFAGFRLDECADMLGVSLRTAARNWAFAQAWLARELTRS
jgi:RNA polymerase sigma factor (TIGR02999 family)